MALSMLLVDHAEEVLLLAKYGIRGCSARDVIV